MKILEEGVKLVLSDKAVEWLCNNCQMYLTFDFIGYLFALEPKHKTGCAVFINGQILLFSTDIKNPIISKRKKKRIIKRFVKNGFLVRSDSFPFPEFAKYLSIPFDTTRANVIPDRFFAEVE